MKYSQNAASAKLGLALTLALSALSWVLLLTPAQVVHAAPKATITVTNTDDNGAGSLRQAIADANPTDTIVFSLTYPAVITLTTGELSVGKNITITGPGPNNLAISGNNASRVFYIFGLTDTVVSGLTIRDGYHATCCGGGVRKDSTGTATFSNVVIFSNTVNCPGSGCTGAGFMLYGGVLFLTNSTIMSNTMLGDSAGGGFSVDAGIATLSNVTVTQNTALHSSGIGGGIHNVGVLTITGSNLTRNSAGNRGGAIFNQGALYIDGNTVVSNNSAGNYAGGIYNCCGSGQVTFLNSTLVNNNAGRAGGVYNENFFTMTNSGVLSNTSSVGQAGGIYNIAHFRLNNSTIGSVTQPNIAASYGGGIYNSGTLTATNAVTIAYNTAGSGFEGGGIFINAGSVYLANTTVANNSAGNGGGISNYGALTLTNSTLKNNAAIFGTGGGGIYQSNSVAVLFMQNSTLSGNTATPSGMNGGGINLGNGSAVIINTTLSGNSANSAGGGLYASGASVYITNTSIISNTAGGGIARTGGVVTIKNTLVAHHTGSNCSGGLTSNGYNLSNDSSCAASFTTSGDQNNVTNPAIGPLANNGGATQTHALLPGSPAINTGTNTGCPSTDQRGAARPIGGTCDSGAYESGYLFLPLIMR